MAYWDYDEDRPLIKGAFCKTFGMLPQEFEELSYSDFIELFPSIDGETTFAAILRTRMETDRSKLKDFTASEYAEWLKWQKRKQAFDKKHSSKITKEENDKKRQEKLQIAEQRLKELMTKSAK